MGGLIVGGVIRAPLAGFAVRLIPTRVMTGMVGTLIMALAIFQAVQLIG